MRQECPVIVEKNWRVAQAMARAADRLKSLLHRSSDGGGPSSDSTKPEQGGARKP